MHKFVKNNILSYVPKSFPTEFNVNKCRVFDLNNKEIKGGNVVYLCERELRVHDNFALQFAIKKAKELNTGLKIVHPKIICDYEPKRLFLERQIQQVKNLFEKSGFDFETVEKEKIEEFLKSQTGVLAVDFNPVLNRTLLGNLDFKIYEIDGHNIVPARFVSDKQEYNASTLRRKIYRSIFPFLTEFDNNFCAQTHSDEVLSDFIENKLQYYAEFKNNPSKNVLSGLSKYLNLGFISPQRVAIEVLKSDVPEINKEVFLEELIIRKELADNFCLYCKNIKTLDCVPDWAKKSLYVHKYDLRQYLYNLDELENAQTHDKLWNATQIQLVKEGVIHGYLRMYWAKKLLEWTNSADEALKYAIYLNDKYAYDAPSASGYVGILWAIAGLHDRAFQDWFVTGKIRRMTFNSMTKKFDIWKYINEYS